MSARTVLYVLLAVVATAAAVLSFEALRGLALVCGFAWWTAPLLPAVVDAGAAAGTLAWLTGAGRARWFGRALALALLGLSVGGNAVGHALAAYGLAAPWPLVVAVSGVAPAVLGCCVHLAVVATQGHTDGSELAADSLDEDLGYVGMVDEHGISRYWADAPPDRTADLIAAGAGRRRLSRELNISEHQARALLAERRNGSEATR